MARPPDSQTLPLRPSWQRGLQMAYAMLFSGLVVAPNIIRTPSLAMVGVGVLVAVWIIGCLADWRRFDRADELILCGSAAPLILGLWTLATRLVFICSHRALTDPRMPGVTASGFLAAWLLEILLVLLPGAVFFMINIRALRPLPPFDQRTAVKRPSSRKRRT